MNNQSGSVQEISFAGYTTAGYRCVGGWGHTVRVRTPTAMFEVSYVDGVTYIEAVDGHELRAQPVGECAIVVETDNV